MPCSKCMTGIFAVLASMSLMAQSTAPTPPDPNASAPAASGAEKSTGSDEGTGKVTTSPPGPSSPVQKDGKKKGTHKPDKAKDDRATIEKVPPANPANH